MHFIIFPENMVNLLLILQHQNQWPQVKMMKMSKLAQDEILITVVVSIVDL